MGGLGREGGQPGSAWQSAEGRGTPGSGSRGEKSEGFLGATDPAADSLPPVSLAGEKTAGMVWAGLGIWECFDYK